MLQSMGSQRVRHDRVTEHSRAGLVGASTIYLVPYHCPREIRDSGHQDVGTLFFLLAFEFD